MAALHLLLGDWVGDPPAEPPLDLTWTWNTSMQEWLPDTEYLHDGTSWNAEDVDLTWAGRSPFDPYIGAGTIWQRDVSAMPLATLSDDFADWMAAHITYAPGGGFGQTSFNHSAAGTHPVQCYLIDSRYHPRIHKEMMVGNFASSYANSILSGMVPWLPWVTPQTGQDSAVAIVDIGTGIIREWYLVAKRVGTLNVWTCVTGGYSIAKPDLVDWAATNYATQLAEGSNVVVRMHNWLGFTGISEARRGHIDHALAYTCANMNVPTSSGEAIKLDGTRYTSVGPSWPALGGDGDSVGLDIPIHGQWARVKSGLDLSPTGPYSPFVRMHILAAQTYGMVATDSNNFVHAFNGEPGFTEKWFTGTDPWSSTGDLFQKFSKMNIAEGRDGTTPFSMATFPWAETEWAPRNWGKPE